MGAAGGFASGCRFVSAGGANARACFPAVNLPKRRLAATEGSFFDKTSFLRLPRALSVQVFAVERAVSRYPVVTKGIRALQKQSDIAYAQVAKYMRVALPEVCFWIAGAVGFCALNRKNLYWGLVFSA